MEMEEAKGLPQLAMGNRHPLDKVSEVVLSMTLLVQDKLKEMVLDKQQLATEGHLLRQAVVQLLKVTEMLPQMLMDKVKHKVDKVQLQL